MKLIRTVKTGKGVNLVNRVNSPIIFLPNHPKLRSSLIPSGQFTQIHINRLLMPVTGLKEVLHWTR